MHLWTGGRPISTCNMTHMVKHQQGPNHTHMQAHEIWDAWTRPTPCVRVRRCGHTLGFTHTVFPSAHWQLAIRIYISVFMPSVALVHFLNEPMKSYQVQASPLASTVLHGTPCFESCFTRATQGKDDASLLSPTILLLSVPAAIMANICATHESSRSQVCIGRAA